MAVRPIRLGVLIPCCAVERDGGIAVSSRLGPQIEMMAELVSETTILGYDPPTTGLKLEDRTDFVMRPATPNIRFVSLGPKGNYRDWWSRRKRVAEIVRRESAIASEFSSCCPKYSGYAARHSACLLGSSTAVDVWMHSA